MTFTRICLIFESWRKPQNALHKCLWLGYGSIYTCHYFGSHKICCWNNLILVIYLWRGKYNWQTKLVVNLCLWFKIDYQSSCPLNVWWLNQVMIILFKSYILIHYVCQCVCLWRLPLWQLHQDKMGFTKHNFTICW